MGLKTVHAFNYRLFFFLWCYNNETVYCESKRLTWVWYQLQSWIRHSFQFPWSPRGYPSWCTTSQIPFVRTQRCMRCTCNNGCNVKVLMQYFLPNFLVTIKKLGICLQHWTYPWNALSRMSRPRHAKTWCWLTWLASAGSRELKQWSKANVFGSFLKARL